MNTDKTRIFKIFTNNQNTCAHGYALIGPHSWNVLSTNLFLRPFFEERIHEIFLSPICSSGRTNCKTDSKVLIPLTGCIMYIHKLFNWFLIYFLIITRFWYWADGLRQIANWWTVESAHPSLSKDTLQRHTHECLPQRAHTCLCRQVQHTSGHRAWVCNHWQKRVPLLAQALYRYQQSACTKRKVKHVGLYCPYQWGLKLCLKAWV